MKEILERIVEKQKEYINYLEETSDFTYRVEAHNFRDELASLQSLKEKEEKIPQWYSKQEIYDWLIVHSYSKEIATELSQIWADDLQGAFKKGWEKSKYELSKQSPAEPLTELRKELDLACDVCGKHPAVIVQTQFGRFCMEHARYI